MWGTNPCSEIILRPYQFCNLSEVVVRENDTGVPEAQSTSRNYLKYPAVNPNDFKYLRKVWRDNTEEERLLGVSLTGIMDHSILSRPSFPSLARRDKTAAVDTNLKFAQMLGILSPLLSPA